MIPIRIGRCELCGSIIQHLLYGLGQESIRAQNVLAYEKGTATPFRLIDVEPESQFMFLAWFTFTPTTAANPNEQQWYHNLRVVEKIRHYAVLREVFSRFDHPLCGLRNEVFQCLLFGRLESLELDKIWLGV